MEKTITKLKCGFYYGLLSIDEQVLYKKIGVAVSEMDEEVFLWNCDRSILSKVLIAIKYDNAEFFYWESEKSVLKGNTLMLLYRFKNSEEAAGILEEIRMERMRLIEAECDEETSSPKEILLKVYNYLKETLSPGDIEAMRPECSKWIYDIEGVFIKKKATCLGISQAFNYICGYLHFSSVLITGTLLLNGKEVNHGWNMVNIDGEFYHFDLSKEIEINSNHYNHYFMVMSDDLNDRKWSKSIYTQR